MSYLGNPLSSMNYPVDYFTGDGTSTTFTLSYTPASATSILVYISGVKQVASTTNPAYYLIGNQLILSAAPAANSPIEVNYLGIASQVNVPSSQSITQSMLSLQIANTFVTNTITNGTQNVITLVAPPVSSNSLIVTANGVVQYDYYVNGSNLYLNFTPPAGTRIRAQGIALTTVGVPNDASITSAKLSSNLTFTGTSTFAANVVVAGNLNLTNALGVAYGGTGTTTSTGTGSNVLNTSPSLVTPSLGTATATYLTSSSGITVGNGDLYLNRNDQNPAYITRPYTTGYKGIAFACAGGYPLDAVTLTSTQTYISGYLGVGSTTNNGEKLRIAIGSAASPSTSGNMNTASIFETGDGGQALNFGQDASGTWYNSAYANNAGVPLIHRWLVGGTEAMRISSTGNTSIGTATSWTKLNIESTFPSTGLYEVPGITLAAYNGSVEWPTGSVSSYIAAGTSNSVSNFPGGLMFKTKPADGGATNTLTTRMVIDAQGNVGIGNTAPSYLLDVSGVVRASASASIDPYVQGNTVAIGNVAAATGFAAPGITMGPSAGNHGAIVYAANQFYWGSESGSGNNMTTIMTLSSSGVLAFNSGYGSAATAYGCRAWVNFNGSGTASIRASGNVSSVTRNATGDYTVNFTNAMPDANFATTGLSLDSNWAWLNSYNGTAQTTTSTRVVNHTTSSGSLQDSAQVAVVVHR